MIPQQFKKKKHISKQKRKCKDSILYCLVGIITVSEDQDCWLASDESHHSICSIIFQLLPPSVRLRHQSLVNPYQVGVSKRLRYDLALNASPSKNLSKSKQLWFRHRRLEDLFYLPVVL